MRRLVLVALVGLIAGCITPSIPIPPPDPADMTFNVTVTANNSTAVFSYPPNQNYGGGIAYVFDQMTGVGVIQRVNTDDSVGPTQPFAAFLGDQVVFTVENDRQTSSTCVVLRQGAQDPTNYCQ